MVDKSEIGNLIMLYGFLGIAYELLCLIVSTAVPLENTDLPLGYPIFNPVLAWMGQVHTPNSLVSYLFPMAIIIFGFWLSRTLAPKEEILRKKSKSKQ